MADETVLFNSTTNKFCLLNSSAALVWEKLESPQTADGLAKQLCDAYPDVSEEQAVRDVERALKELAALSLVVGDA